ncbi:MAG: hypothetical protein ABI229_10735 [Gemmatimonadaceae bacterium]
MPILRSVTAALVSRRTARRLTKIIPNPLVRYAIVTVATALVPVIIDKIAERWHGRRLVAATQRRLAAGTS